MSEENRVALTVRMKPSDKQVFVAAAAKMGLEPGTAARTLLEMMASRLRENDDFLEVLMEAKTAWRESAKAA
jgi:hypothetical protein